MSFIGQASFLKDWSDPPQWLVAAVQNDVTVHAVYRLAVTSDMGKDDFLIRLARALFESRKVFQQAAIEQRTNEGMANDGNDHKGG